MTYMTQNGWTVDAICDRIRARNNGTRAYNDGSCRYRTPDGNHCAVGAFIPADCSLPARQRERFDIPLTTPFSSEVNVGPLLQIWPELIEFMPLPLDALYELQRIHDDKGLDVSVDVRTLLCDWVRQNCKDDPLLAGAPAEAVIEGEPVGRITCDGLNLILAERQEAAQ